MIREFSVKAKPTNNKARVTFVTLLSCAGLTFGAYLVMRAFEVQKSGLFGLIPLALVIAAVFIYTKYVSPVYYYELASDSDGYPLFVVRQTYGKRTSTLCRIGLSEITGLERETRSQRRAHKTPRTIMKYNYLPTLLPNYTYRITTRSRYEQAEIVIEINDEFAELLKGYIKEAKDRQIADEDDY